MFNQQEHPQGFAVFDMDSQRPSPLVFTQQRSLFVPSYTNGPTLFPFLPDASSVQRPVIFGAAPQLLELELHDGHLKSPITVRMGDLVPTNGSNRIFIHSGATKAVFRVCDAFFEGQCQDGYECNDVHVEKNALAHQRQRVTSWLDGKETEFRRLQLTDSLQSFRVFCADLKEVVDVPVMCLSFTRGLYVDPSSRAKRSKHHQQSAFAVMASQVPTACGLYAVDPMNCKWGKWCNQAHIVPSFLSQKRDQFKQWSHSLESQFSQMPVQHVFQVHDPQTRSTVHVPRSSISEFTRGLFQGSQKKAPSVCMLNQRGKCTARSCCNQVHVNVEFLAKERRAALGSEPPSVAPRNSLNPQALPFQPPTLTACDPDIPDMLSLGPPILERKPTLDPGSLVPLLDPSTTSSTPTKVPPSPKQNNPYARVAAAPLQPVVIQQRPPTPTQMTLGGVGGTYTAHRRPSLTSATMPPSLMFRRGAQPTSTQLNFSAEAAYLDFNPSPLLRSVNDNVPQPIAIVNVSYGDFADFVRRPAHDGSRQSSKNFSDPNTPPRH